LGTTSSKARTRSAIALPTSISRIPKLALTHRFASRNVVIAELALFHGFSASQIAAMNVGNVDLKNCAVSRTAFDQWIPLVSDNIAAWKEIAESASETPDSPLLRTRRGVRVSRVDVWRVLRRLGVEAQLAVPLHTRRSRKWVGNALGRRAIIGIESLKLAMGVRDPRSVSRYLRGADPADLPDHVITKLDKSGATTSKGALRP
jgi:hypothetical protein